MVYDVASTTTMKILKRCRVFLEKQFCSDQVSLMVVSVDHHTRVLHLSRIHLLYTAQNGFVVILRFPNLPVYIDSI